MNRFILSLAALLVLTGALIGYFFALEKRLPRNIQDLGQTLFAQVQTIPQEVDLKSEITTKVPQVEKLENIKLPEGDASDQLKTLADRAGDISQHAQNVLGASIQKNEKEATPLQESALEYGKYIYCKQVVTNYEAAQTEPAKEPADETTQDASE